MKKTKKLQMKKILIIKITIMLVLAIFLLYTFLYYYSLSKINISNIKINKLSDFDLNGFVLDGNLELHNKGLLPVKISHIDFFIILEQTGNELAHGKINGGKILPGKKENYPLTAKISWVPSAQIAIELIGPEKIFIEIHGNIYLSGFKIINYTIPFSKKIDIKDYILQFAKEKIEQTADKLIDSTKKFLFE